MYACIYECMPVFVNICYRPLPAAFVNSWVKINYYKPSPTFPHISTPPPCPILSPPPLLYISYAPSILLPVNHN